MPLKKNIPIKIYLITLSVILGLVYCTYHIGKLISLDDDEIYQNTIEYKNTRLLEAVRNTDNLQTEKLLEQGANPNLITDYGEPLLYLAAEKNSSEIVELLLKYKANPNQQVKYDKEDFYNNGETALILAARNKNLKIVKLLLDNKANPNISSKNSSALSASTADTTAELFKYLYSKGARFNIEKETSSHSSLISAASNANHRILDFIIHNDGKKLINQQRCSGCDGYALHHAITSKSLKSAEILLQNGANPQLLDRDGKTAYLTAFYHAENPAFMDLLVKYGAKKSRIEYSDSLMHSALIKNNPILFKRLLSLGGKINYRDNNLNSALHIIAPKGSDTLFIKYLIQNGVTVNTRNKYGQTPLMLALENKNHYLAEYLLKYQTDYNQKDRAGNSLLNQFVKSGCSMELLRKLIDKRINTDYDFNNGFEVIKYLVNLNDSIYAFRVINRETDWSFKDKYSLSMVNWAIGSKKVWLSNALIRKKNIFNAEALTNFKANLKLNTSFADFKRALLKNEGIPAEFYLIAGFSPNIKDENGYTPLIIVIENYYTSRYYDHDAHLGEKNLELLIKYQANLNLSDNDGWTPLMYAAAYGYDEPIAKLIQAGAKTNLKNKNGKTALDLYLVRNKDVFDTNNSRTIELLKGR